MKNNSTYRIIGIFLFILSLLASVMIVLAILQVDAIPEPFLSELFQFLYVGVILLANLVIFILLLAASTSKEKQAQAIQAQKQYIEKEFEEKPDYTRKQTTVETQKQRVEENYDEIISRLTKDLDIQQGAQKYAEKLLGNIAKEFQIVQGIFYLRQSDSNRFTMTGNYAYYTENEIAEFEIGDGLSGQVAKNKTLLNIDDIPEDYIKIISGLGSGTPKHLIIFPIIYNDDTIAVFELASFIQLDKQVEDILQVLSDKTAKKINSFR